MKIAIISPGRMPVPPINGGAVETLINDFIIENSKNSNLDIDLYGCYNKYIEDLKVRNCKFILIKNSKLVRIFRNILPQSLGKINKLINNIQDILYIRSIKQKILKCDHAYDCIIIENKPNFIKQIKGISNSKIILHLHNSHIKNFSADIFESYDSIVTVSKYLKDELIDVHNDISTPVKVLSNCVSEEFFSKPRRNKELVKSEFGFEKKDFVVVFVGRIVEDKGVMELIKAMKLISNPYIKLMVIGASWFDSKEKTEYMKKLEKEAETIKTRITFTGYIRHEELADIEQIADIVVLPSIWNEPFGLTIIEAMSLGKLVITTNKGGIQEIFKGNDGVLIDIDNIEYTIAEEIIYYFNHSNEKEAIEKKALETVNDFFSRTVYYNKFCEILNELNPRRDSN
ncbi:glycosyltransferase family 4 protein [Priestia megaterium]|uniref:glycosyltransferase family 4 protein n=1 Tax=Priestia megaterium TaxID=1404 RepID=UPI0021D6487E|nr:glycosyltransferase family 4 protein [Priestia megaterium]MCU7745541.1 glycosyltransferase family 4 protein [Priestia megaterium]